MDPTDLRASVAEALASGDPIDAETLNAACFLLSRALDDLRCSVPQAAPFVRVLMRVAGRVVIDTGMPDSDPESWSNTEQMAIEWIKEALRPLGYGVVVRPERDG